MAGEQNGVHMNIDATTTAMTGVGSAGDNFGQKWSSAVANGTGGIGQGPMGQGFLAGFSPGEQRLNEEATRIAGAVRKLAEAGELCVQDYQAADTKGAESLRRE
ncbi:hypothetical protein CFN78_00270 [Amycolatopsis antarctica]|uniref:ESX-1 secretion-associated protein n=1 Tax=Amycolatopsis antarctica TaxID=1854586 RepID=A0A263D9P0_9PSEU|nr:hypothetical protein [Amycolatopsis antarctica]OZM74718.1 hypothetical protein CFN78_00270 [Amycolatopsis antarctica]